MVSCTLLQYRSPRCTPLLYRTVSSCMACRLQCACVKRQWHSQQSLLPYTGVVWTSPGFFLFTVWVFMHGLQVRMCVCETAMAAVSIAVHWCRVNLSWFLLVHGVGPLCCVDLRLRAQTAVYNVLVWNGYFCTQGYKCTCFSKCMLTRLPMFYLLWKQQYRIVFVKY